MSFNQKQVLCWICNAPATTGEHKIKRSDLRDTLELFTQSRRPYLNSGSVKNRIIQSIDSKYLKSSARMCGKCNNERSQPYDKSWESLSGWLRSNHRYTPVGSDFRTDVAFKVITKENMKNVQLFFIKQLGLRIVEAETSLRTNMNIDLKSLIQSFLTNSVHPDIFLKFGKRTLSNGQVDVRTTDMPTREYRGRCVLAVWIYAVNWLCVEVWYLKLDKTRAKRLGLWHPSYGTNRIKLHSFDP
jgi:hypothetical protein